MPVTFKHFINEEELTPVSGTQYGSNPGGVHVDHKGNKHYVKFYKDGEQAKTEALTGKIYNHMGIKTLNPEYRQINGKHAVVTPWNKHLSQMHSHEFEKVNSHQAHQLGKMYHAAVLTNNWDVVGLEHDNIVKHKNGDLHSVDQGGAMHYRARGSSKEYGSDIPEHSSLRKPSRPSGHVFNSVFKRHPEAEHKSLDSVKNIDDNHVKGLFANSGLKNWKSLHKSFQSRKEALLNKYEKE